MQASAAPPAPNVTDGSVPAGTAALSIADFARYCRVSESWTWQLIAKGLLPTSKIGRRRLILREDADKFLRQGRAA